jgi:hypothetical protein
MGTISWFYYVCTLAYFAVACLTVMNMLIGVVCDVITTAARAESSARVLIGVNHKILEVLNELDDDQDGMISKSEFRVLMNHVEVIHALYEVDVDVEALVECGEVIFTKYEALTLDAFMAEITKFRCSNPCTLKDILDMRLFLHHEIITEMNMMEDRLRYGSARVAACESRKRKPRMRPMATPNGHSARAQGAQQAHTSSGSSDGDSSDAASASSFGYAT